MKEIFLYAGGIILVSIFTIIIIKFVIKKSYIILNSMLGCFGLLAVNFLADITGIDLGYNVLNVLFSVFLGLPGVAFLIVERLI